MADMIDQRDIPAGVHPAEGRVFVMGSSNMDLITYTPRFPRAGETLIGKTFEQKFGGKGANQAVAAAKLGSRVTMLTMVGTDDFGRQYVSRYDSLSVDTSLVLKTNDAATGIATIAVDDQGENNIIVVPGANGCLTKEAAMGNESLIAKLDECSVFVIQNEVPASTNAAVLKLAQTRGLITIFNAAPATNLEEPFRTELLKTADVICVNEEEATALTGCAVESEEDVTAAAAALLKVMGGDGFVLLTLGKRGALVYGRARGTADETPLVNALSSAIKIAPGNVVDTVGAGDSYTGATATYVASAFAKVEGVDTEGKGDVSDPCALLKRRRTLLTEVLPVAAGRSNLVAGISVQRHGAQASYPDASEVPAFFK